MVDPTLPSKILIVDSDKSVGQGIKAALDKHNIKVDLAADLSTAMYLFNQNPYPVVLVEMAFEELPGLVLLQRWRAHSNKDRSHCGFILLAGNRGPHDSGKSKLLEELDDIELVYKPINPIQLLAYLQKGMQTRLRRIRFHEMSEQAKKAATNKAIMAQTIEMLKPKVKDYGLRGADLIRELHEAHQSWPEALKVVEDVLVEKPEYLNSLNQKGRLLLKMGRHDDALKQMEVVDKLAPQNIQRINDMAVAYLQVNKPDLSVAKMRELIGFHPDQPEIKFDMFAKLQEFGFDQHAIQLCKATANPQEVVRHYNNKGVALSKAGNIEGAILEYERSLRFYPSYKENYRILYNIALAHLSYKTKNHYEIALEFLIKCLELNNKFEKALKTKTQVEEALVKFRKNAS